MEKLLSIREAVDVLGLKRPTIYKYVSQKSIPYVKIGTRVLFDPKDLKEWIGTQKIKPIGD